MTSTAGAETLKSGDRVVFLGDSITQGGAGPQGYITKFRELLASQHPDLKVEVIGAGISGNKVPDLERRLDRDVLEKKPTVVVIYIGINDVWHSRGGKGTPRDVYEKGLRSLIERIKAANARPVLCTASVIGEKTDGSNELDKLLAEYCEVSRQVAESTKVQLIDLNKAFLTYLKQHNPENKDRHILTTDAVHLNDAGNKFVAEQMLTGLVGGGAAEAKAPANSGKKLRHVVLFKFKEGTSAEKIKEITDAFAALPKKIDTIDSFEWGTDNSPEGLADGFTHCFLVTFRDEAGRAKYLPHEDHIKFVELLKPHLEKPLGVDYWTKD